MSRVAFILSLVVLTFAAVEHSGAATSSDSLPNYVAPRYRPAIASWLTRHPGYRVAIDADCTCDDDIAQMRAGYSADWPGVPNYHPYYMVGDFRGDGAADVAVGVISQQHPEEVPRSNNPRHTAQGACREDVSQRGVRLPSGTVLWTTASQTLEPRGRTV
jgi:hypothetical protein